MRAIATVLVGVIGGFILGVAISSFIGVLGMVIIDKPIGIKFLPYFTAMICAVLVPYLDYKKTKSI